MKSKKQPALVCPIDAIGAGAHPMAVFSGSYESPGPPPLGDVGSIVPPHHDGHRNGHQMGTYHIIVLFAVALAAAKGIRSK